MADKADITPELMRQLIAIDEQTNVLTWKTRGDEFCSSPRAARAWNDRWAGKPVGLSRNKNGYLKVGILTHNFMVHRVVFALCNNRWPSGDIDHINRDKSDNRIANLREATCSENNYNMGLTKANKSGVKGVCWIEVKRRWQATIRYEGKSIYLGQFKDINDAAQAYAAASIRYHKEFSCT